MLMKDSAEQLYVDALSGSEAIATRLSDKGMTPAEWGTAQIGAQFRGHGAYANNTRPNTDSYDIAKRSYR